MKGLSLTATLSFFAVLVVAQPLRAQNDLTRLSTSIRELTRRVSPAVVEIDVTGYAPPDDDSQRTVSQISRQHSRASGLIVDPAGYIMTNAHVVLGAVHTKVIVPESGLKEDAQERRLERTDEFDARIIGLDRDSDLALLRIDATKLVCVQFGDSDALQQGDLVFAIGSPLGLRNSLSMGVVSAPARAISNSSPILYIQTDASINPGNSGGALIDTRGLLIGMNTFIVSQSGGNEGIGFAIPSNVVRNVYEQLRTKGRVSRGSVGLFVQDITPPIATGLELPVRRGVVVSDVTPSGPGDRAGVKRRDVIVSMNKHTMYSARQFEDAIYRRQAGEKLEVVILRGQQKLPITVDVEEKPNPGDKYSMIVNPEKNLISRLGILCFEIDQDIVDKMPELRRQYGLVVAAKAPDGQMQFVDLEAGDVIHAMNGQPIATLSSFRERLDALKQGDSVVLQIERDGRFQYVGFEIE